MSHCSSLFSLTIVSELSLASLPAGPGYVDYILAPPTASNEQASVQDDTVVYCIDVSGSMGCTTKVPPLQAEWKRAREQQMGVNSTSSQYVSRLECIQVAITIRRVAHLTYQQLAARKQLEHLAVQHPKKRVRS